MLVVRRIRRSDGKIRAGLNLSCYEVRRIGRDAWAHVAVGIRGNRTVRSLGVIHDAELPLQMAGGNLSTGEEQPRAVRKPNRIVKNFCARISKISLRTGGDINGKKSADVIGRRLNDGKHDCSSVRRPGYRVAVGRKRLFFEKRAFWSSVG